MNWTRTVLDGFAMAAYFNLFAGLVALYKPRLMFPCYPPAIIKAAKDPPTVAVFDVPHPGGGSGRAGAAHRNILVKGKKTRCAA